MDRSQVIAHYSHQVAKLNGVASAATQFSVAPQRTQVLIDQIQLDSSFLNKIKLNTVVNQGGQVLGLDGRLIASTTNTSQGDKERSAKSAGTLAQLNDYLCRQVDFDTGITYAEIDQWAHMSTFAPMLKNRVVSGTALSLICIGFNGLKWTGDSNAAQNPLLQDVQKGWLQKNRENNKARCLGGDDVVNIGKTHEYTNIDALAQDLKTQLSEVHVERTDLVAIVGRSLLNAKTLKVINQADHQATELNAASAVAYDKLVGGLPALTVPYFPDNAILITPLANLAIYIQLGSHRRSLLDEPKRNQLGNYESMNIDYIIEDYAACAMAENIVMVADNKDTV